MSIGKRLARTTPAIVLKLSGHCSIGPRGVVDQSNVRARSSIPRVAGGGVDTMETSDTVRLARSTRGGSELAAASVMVTLVTSVFSNWLCEGDGANSEPNTSDYFTARAPLLPRVDGRHLGRRGVEVLEAHHPPLFFVPERETKRGDAAPNRDDGRLLQEPSRRETALQSVVRNAWREMMHVMEPNAACEPLQYGREDEMRAAA